MLKASYLITALIGALALATGCQTTQSPEASNLVSAEAEAQEEYSTQSVAVSDPDYDPDEIICKTDTTTGSRLAKTKDCRTAEQWRRSMTNATRAVTDYQNTHRDGVKME
jgi:hypothetical protein